MTTWIEAPGPDEADEALADVYRRVVGPGAQVDNILRVHGLRPHTLEGHMALYRSVLHHRLNVVPRWFLEVVGIHASLLNGCGYCVEHHAEGLRRALRDDARATALHEALVNGRLSEIFDDAQCVALEYVRVLTDDPAAIRREHVDAMRDAGWSDGEILEINQVTSYFNYANRTVLGLGVTLGGERRGESPSTS